MKNYEIGILPESTCYSFSPSAEERKLFYYMFWCGHFFCDSDYYVKRETYPPLLLIYVRAGGIHLHLDHKTYDAVPGQVLFFDCQRPHHYYVKESCEFYYLHFDGPRAHEICSLINKSRGVLINGPKNELIREEMDELVRLCDSGVTESSFETSLRIYRIFSLLDDPEHSPGLKKNDDSIARSIAYIRAHPEQKLPLSQLAEISHLSVYYYSHLFKEMTGVSPAEYIIKTRIETAKTLLTTTTLSIAEIANQVGYQNAGNLITLFTKRVGCSPARFRKNQGLNTREKD